MADDRDVLSAADLDELEPNERARAVRAKVVDDLDRVPEEFRRRITSTAGRLSAELSQRTPE